MIPPAPRIVIRREKRERPEGVPQLLARTRLGMFRRRARRRARACSATG